MLWWLLGSELGPQTDHPEFIRDFLNKCCVMLHELVTMPWAGRVRNFRFLTVPKLVSPPNIEAGSDERPPSYPVSTAGLTLFAAQCCTRCKAEKQVLKNKIFDIK
jgi:hypothetical protein